MNPSEYLRIAREETGLGRFANDSYRDGFELLAEGFDRCQTLSVQGRKILDGWMLTSLRERLRIDDWIERHPDVLQVPVSSPAFIIGLPRTGSSALHAVLGVDDRLRVVRNWEVENLTPPVEAKHLHDDPRIAIKKKAWDARVAAGLVGPRAELPEDPAECTFLMKQDFKSLIFEHAIDNPADREWLDEKADMVAAFRQHQRILQTLQSRAPGCWILKHPPHTLFLDALHTVYPDAKLICLHRDPLAAATSYCSLIRFYRGMISDSVDPIQIRDQIFPQLVAHVTRLMGFRDRHPEIAVLDVHYPSLRADPMGEMRRIYNFIGIEFPPELEQKMLVYLDEHARRPFGKHDYSLEDFGVSRSRALADFKEYIDRYEIQVH